MGHWRSLIKCPSLAAIRMKRFVSENPVLAFVILTLGMQFAIVWVVGHYLSVLPEGARIHDSEEAHMVFRFRAFGPLLFAVLLTAWLEGREGLKNLFGAFLNWRVHPKWYVLAFSWKFLFTYVGIAVVFALGISGWPGWGAGTGPEGLGHALEGMVSNLPFIIGIAFVEETAWMKFCVTRMQQRYGALVSSALVGVAWGLWYLPMLLIREGVPDGYPWHMFLLSMIALTIFLSWTYNMTRSGVILLIMQIVSNCAFFIIPVLPAWFHGDAIYINAFVTVNIITATSIVFIFGPKNLANRERARWDEHMPGKERRPDESPVEAISA